MAGQPEISRFFKKIQPDRPIAKSPCSTLAGKVIDKPVHSATKCKGKKSAFQFNQGNNHSVLPHGLKLAGGLEEEITSTPVDREVSEVCEVCEVRVGKRDQLAEDMSTEEESDGQKLSLKRKSSKRARTSINNTQLTPLDQQIKELKEANMDKLLVVRVGYKYKCFAQDAVIASHILHIKLIAGKLTIDGSNPHDSNFRQFAYCSFPDTRLNVHLERLIHHDLRVGVVEQSETSAVKKYSKETSKSNVFQRSITNVFSKATYGINNAFVSGNGPILGDNNSIWALSVSSTTDINTFFLISVNLSSGEVVYDKFEDSVSSSNKFVTRLNYLSPKELVTDTKLTGELGKCLEKRSCQVYVKSWHEEIDESIKSVCEEVRLEMKQMCTVNILYEYLKGYGNERILLIHSAYRPFVSKTHMLLNSNTFESLDIFSNEGGKGSLFWLLDHTRTSFGSRQLKEWLCKPLLNRRDIEDRLDAVECIKRVIDHLFFESLNRMLKTSPDLVRSLNRIAYGSTSRKEVYHFLKQLFLFASHIEAHSSFLENQVLSEDGSIRNKSSLLTSIISEMVVFSKDNFITQLLSMINASAIIEKDQEKQIVEFFNLNNYDRSEILVQRQRNISAVQEELSDELQKIRKFLKRPHMDYKDSLDYLIEVRNTQVKGLPFDWVKVNNTKMVSRFHTPVTRKLVEKLQYHKDLLLNEADQEFRHFVGRIKEKYANLRSLIDNIGIYDVLLSLAATSCSKDYSRPVFNDQKQFIKAISARNPVIESLDVNYVPNDVKMSETDGKVLILTGPNMGGKSSYIRQVALLVILAQIGSFVPADYMEISIFDSIFTRIGACDDLLQGNSTFKVELVDVMNIIENYSSRSLILLDEVGRGTSTEDGKAIAYSLVNYFLADPYCPLILFTTHYPTLATISHPLLRSYYMDYFEEKNIGEHWASVVFLYKLRPGISKNSFGLNVAKLAGIDKSIINNAFQLSEALRKESEFNEHMTLPFRLRHILSSDTLSCNDKLQRLLKIDE